MTMLDEPLKIVKERWDRQVEVMRPPISDQQMITDELGNSLSWSCLQHPCAQGTRAVLMDKGWFGMTHPMMAIPMLLNISSAHWSGSNYMHSWRLAIIWKDDTSITIQTQTSTLITNKIKTLPNVSLNVNQIMKFSQVSYAHLEIVMHA